MIMDALKHLFFSMLKVAIRNNVSLPHNVSSPGKRIGGNDKGDHRNDKGTKTFSHSAYESTASSHLQEPPPLQDHLQAAVQEAKYF